MKYIDKDGNVSTEDSGQDKLLARIYNHRWGRELMKLLVRPGISKAGGWLLEKGWSKCLIKPFIARTKMDMSCYETEGYESYNAFFTRQIKPGYRPLEGDGQTLVSPCDGKLSVYRIHYGERGQSRFLIKNTSYTVESLLRSEKLAKQYDEGIACVFRLTVDDYHRFCYVDDGVKSRNYRLPGVFHTVNPAANDVVPVYQENTREFSLLKSEHFGTVLMMEVGALLVGRITNYHGECSVKRGQEKGRFEFGGSTVILLFQKEAVKMERRLFEHTENGLETIVKMGEKIGTCETKETQ